MKGRKRTLTDASSVVVACSGGADSLALLALACDADRDVLAVYVDHGLRSGTAHDAAIVAQAAARFGAGARVEHVHVAPGSSLEARARDARYAALERVRAAVGADAILTGHTRDDQAETVLLNLLRGSAASGLAGIPARRGYVRRPLLAMRRAETRELCATLGLVPAHDPMNDDLRHRRVWLRREIIPQLERGADRDLVDVLARQADVLRDDDDLLSALATERLTDDAATLAAMPVALARRVVRLWLGGSPPARAAVERVLAVARGDVAATELSGGDRVERVGGRLVRIRSGARTATTVPEPVPLALPGRARFGDLELEAWVEHGPPLAWPDGRWVAVCDADLVPAAAVVSPAAGGPPARRPVSPVVEADGPLWRVGYGIERRVRVSSRTRRYLWLSAQAAHLPDVPVPDLV